MTGTPYQQTCHNGHLMSQPATENTLSLKYAWNIHQDKTHFDHEKKKRDKFKRIKRMQVMFSKQNGI